MNLEEMEKIIAARIFRYFPLFDKGMYSSTVYSLDGVPIKSITVQFQPSLRLQDALVILDKLNDHGWDYTITCYQNESRKREHQGINISPYELRCYKGKQSIYSVDVGHEQYNSSSTLIDAIIKGAYGVALMMPKYEAAEEEML